MKLLSLQILVKSLVILLLINNEFLQKKTELEKILNKEMKALINNRNNFGLTCENNSRCIKAANNITFNLHSDPYKKSLIRLFKCIIHEEYYENGKSQSEIDYNNFYIFLYYEHIKDSNVDKLHCFLQSYHNLRDIVDWILIAKDFKQHCLKIYLKYLNEQKFNKNLLHIKEIELDNFFDFFQYILIYIYKNFNIYNEKYLFGIYTLDDNHKKYKEYNKLFNIKNKINSRKIEKYFYSPNPLEFSNDFSTVFKYAKDQAKKSKVIFFVLENNKNEFLGYLFNNLVAANHYYTVPYSTFKTSKIEIKCKKDFHAFNHKYNSDYKNKFPKIKKLSKNITIIKLKQLYSYFDLTFPSYRNIIFSIMDATKQKSTLKN